ncbi:MAG TPA: N-acetylmuramoyl-L-alanine amidase [Candidatus Anaerostipes avistercoris]|uniref:N-acetylmuramoyl-L-alanine amidase n=1 Tax=Candidatus Anaerostipes avistercoris TaxID=2838462 RepID=A0A9D2PED6_9FIRM|nr:N-acetylmuramoyl-L-alanine amidase [Candidatus Anaerostipes avistercoris]
MAKYNVHGGHNRKVPGASGVLDEVTEDRKVKNAVIKYLKAQGHTAYDCTDDAGTTQGKNLANIVVKCNSHDGIELDISVHLNAGRDDDEGDGKTGGTEVLIYSTAVKDVAKDIADEIAKEFDYALRSDETTPKGCAGVKIVKSLYVLKHTKAKAVLIEPCFVDDKDDAKVWNADRCAKAIVRAITGKAVAGGSSTSGSSSSGSGNKTTTTSSTPFYKVGNTYTLQSNMVVRTGAGTNYRAKKHSELTADGQKHDKDKNGCLDKGTRITCQQVKKSGSNIWVKCPSGWIAAYYNKKTYVK